MFTTPNFLLTDVELKELRDAFKYDLKEERASGEVPRTNCSERASGEVHKRPHKEKYEHMIFRLEKYTPMLTKISNLLNNEGFPVKTFTPQNFQELSEVSILEYHIYFGYTDSDEVEFVFGAHRDDDNFPVHTFIYYPTITFPKGGRLCVKKKNAGGIGEYTKEEKKEGTKESGEESVVIIYDHESNFINPKNYLPIDPRQTKCVCLSGSLMHFMENCVGKGIRGSIVIQNPVE